MQKNSWNLHRKLSANGRLRQQNICNGGRLFGSENSEQIQQISHQIAGKSNTRFGPTMGTMCNAKNGFYWHGDGALCVAGNVMNCQRPVWIEPEHTHQIHYRVTTNGRADASWALFALHPMSSVWVLDNGEHITLEHFLAGVHMDGARIRKKKTSAIQCSVLLTNQQINSQDRCFAVFICSNQTEKKTDDVLCHTESVCAFVMRFVQCEMKHSFCWMTFRLAVTSAYYPARNVIKPSLCASHCCTAALQHSPTDSARMQTANMQSLLMMLIIWLAATRIEYFSVCREWRRFGVAAGPNRQCTSRRTPFHFVTHTHTQTLTLSNRGVQSSRRRKKKQPTQTHTRYSIDKTWYAKANGKCYRVKNSAQYQRTK